MSRAAESATVDWTSNRHRKGEHAHPHRERQRHRQRDHHPARTQRRRRACGSPPPPTPEPSFEVTAAAQGEPGDQVVEQGGATVYLDQTAAELLDDKVLDAAVDPAGKVEFALGLQG